MCGPVLIVEDNYDIRENLGILLGESGHAVLGAENGQVALDLLEQSERPCMIILDLMMPVMNGWEFRTKLLERPGLAEIPVVLMSAHADVERNVEQLQAVAHIGKPMDLNRLFELVETYC